MIDLGTNSIEVQHVWTCRACRAVETVSIRHYLGSQMLIPSPPKGWTVFTGEHTQGILCDQHEVSVDVRLTPRLRLVK